LKNATVDQYAGFAARAKGIFKPGRGLKTAFSVAGLLLARVCPAGDGLLVVGSPGPNDFDLAQRGHTSAIFVDPESNRATKRAANDLADDLERVTGLRPLVVTELKDAGRFVVIIGELGSSVVVDRLAAAHKIDADGIRGQWESNIVQAVELPAPGVDRAVVIAGSDCRGTIYGIYAISEAIGVSPWSWWADVPVKRHNELWIASGKHQHGPPAVKYRGIFLNDEDWGLRPWAAGTFDPRTGNIGPKTYAKVFELLLRLHANLLWPAMHPGTRAFNFFPDDKVAAGEYGIVMGSSHAEPMLRDNVDEWNPDIRGPYDYSVNRLAVLKYWEERVRENARYENIYTVGMRGIHDSPMAGGGSVGDRAARLRNVIMDQRAILQRWVNKDLDRVPQMFCPYKEVLPVYRHAPGNIPADVTLMWPDDDYGYIQHLSTPAEERREGRAGVYYHVSYWGRPYDYLWLCSTPPALIGEEMTKAFDYGADRIWVLNVGDLKPAEIDIEFFLKLAWDPAGWNPETGQHGFLRNMAVRDFGETLSGEIASIWDEYYRLNFQRKPEHMGIDPTNQLMAVPSFRGTEPVNEAQGRLAAFANLSSRTHALAERVDPQMKDAFYELVQYPVQSAALMNQKGLNLAAYGKIGETEAAKEAFLVAVRRAQSCIDQETAYYNERLAGGKWKGMMSDAPRALPVFGMPPGSIFTPAFAAAELEAPGEAAGRLEVRAVDAQSRLAGKKASWRTIGGLGYGGAAIAVSPNRFTVESDPAKIQKESPSVTYPVRIAHSGNWDVVVRRLPTWASDPSKPLRYAVSFDDGPVQVVATVAYMGENDLRWQKDVLRNASYSLSTHHLAGGVHSLRIWGVDPGLILDSLLIAPCGYTGGSYAWPAEKEILAQSDDPARPAGSL
jgi:hypothetical protein